MLNFNKLRAYTRMARKRIETDKLYDTYLIMKNLYRDFRYMGCNLFAHKQ